MPALAELLNGRLSYGMREDGTPKGAGYFGPLKRPDGDESTELSFDFDHPQRGKVFAPLIVPTLSREELDHLLADKKPTDAIYGKAQEFALGRLQAGMPTFARSGEQFRPPNSPAPSLMDILRRIAPAAGALGQMGIGVPISIPQERANGFMGVRS